MQNPDSVYFLSLLYFYYSIFKNFPKPMRIFTHTVTHLEVFFFGGGSESVFNAYL